MNTYVNLPIFRGLDVRGGKNYEQAHTHTRDNHSAATTITSAIQRINGASLKEHWAAQRNQVYKQQYQRLQHDTGLKYKMGIFLKLSTVMIAQRSSVYCTEIYIQCNLIITVTLGPNLAGCYIEVAFLLSGIQNHHN